VRGVRLGAAATKVALAPPWALLGHRVVLRTMYTWSLGVAIASWLRFHVLRGRVTTLLRQGIHMATAHIALP
jgi:broad specificity phosphatase PhoE